MENNRVEASCGCGMVNVKSNRNTKASYNAGLSAVLHNARHPNPFQLSHWVDYYLSVS